MTVYAMVNPVRHYAWGSRTTLAALQGRPHADQPEAELWIGSHPLAPSHLVRPDGERAPLPRHLAADPAGVLGSAVLDRFGARLPFLVKLLAVDTPLSLQVHPTAERARAGFAAEEARGVPRDASSRSYKDPFAKPELLCALTPFEALAGFRPAAEVASLLAALDIPRLRDLAAALTDAAGPAELQTAFTRLMTWPLGDRAALVSEVAAAAHRSLDALDPAASGGPVPDRRPAEASPSEPYPGPSATVLAHTCRWITRLAARHPGDPGVVCALLLAHVRLEPGQALFVPPGCLHAYLQGFAIEVMGSSDNVVRGGLTDKHVDVGDLLDVTDVECRPPPLAGPEPAEDGREAWPAPAAEFRLERSRVLAGRPVRREVRGPTVFVCVGGAVDVASDDSQVRLTPGTSAFADAATTVVLDGTGPVYHVEPGFSET
jgi:mannose-6-phosphate isomerase